MEPNLLVKSTEELIYKIHEKWFFCDHANEFYTDKADTFKSLENIQWQCDLKQDQKTFSYVIPGIGKHHQKLAQKLSDDKEVTVEVPLAHPREFIQTLRHTQGRASVLFSGVAESFEERLLNSHDSIARIWPDIGRTPWHSAMDCIERFERDQRCEKQCIVSDIEGGTKIRKSWHNAKKSMNRFDRRSIMPGKKEPQDLHAPPGWAIGYFVVDSIEGDEAVHLDHCKYTGTECDFIFLDQLFRKLEENQAKPESLYVSCYHATVAGFLDHQFRKRYPATEITLLDFVFGRNFMMGYSHFLTSPGNGVLVDFNYFPDIYFLSKKGKS